MRVSLLAFAFAAALSGCRSDVGTRSITDPGGGGIVSVAQNVSFASMDDPDDFWRCAPCCCCPERSH